MASLDALLELVDDLKVRQRHRLKAELVAEESPDPLALHAADVQAWLALVELWTPQLAGKSGFPFPPGGVGPDEFFQTFQADGLVERVDAGGTTWQMPAALRREVLRGLLQNKQYGPPYLAR